MYRGTLEENHVEREVSVSAHPRRVHAPWLRSTEESLPRQRLGHGEARPAELLVAALVIAAVAAMAIWFLFIAVGGLSPGTV